MTPIAPEGRRLEAAAARSSNELPSSEPFYRLAEGGGMMEDSDFPGPVAPLLIVGAALVAVFGLGGICGALFFGVKAVVGS